MKIAVTGGSGKIGRAITEIGLAQGHQIVSIDRVAPADPLPGVTYHVADCADYDALVAAFAGCDAVIHMAAVDRLMPAQQWMTIGLVRSQASANASTLAA